MSGEPYIEVWRTTESSRFENVMSALLGTRWQATPHDGGIASIEFFSYTRARAIKKAARYMRTKKPTHERISLKDLA